MNGLSSKFRLIVRSKSIRSHIDLNPSIDLPLIHRLEINHHVNGEFLPVWLDRTICRQSKRLRPLHLRTDESEQSVHSKIVNILSVVDSALRQRPSLSQALCKLRRQPIN